MPALACALLGDGKAAAALPSITTAAQPPGFCPAFLAIQDAAVVLNQQSMRTLAMQVNDPFSIPANRLSSACMR